jgi:hypothetical protein
MVSLAWKGRRKSFRKTKKKGKKTSLSYLGQYRGIQSYALRKGFQQSGLRRRAELSLSTDNREQKKQQHFAGGLEKLVTE